MTAAFRQHLNKAADLVTPYEAIRAGFVAIALEKNRRASPFVEQARALKVQATRVRRAEDLTGIADLQPALLTAAGLSDKAKGHLSDENKTEAVGKFIDEFLRPAGRHFVEELVYRFLLTKGGTLGGSMRNVAGQVAERRVREAIVSILALRESDFSCRETGREWRSVKRGSSAEAEVDGLSWNIRGADRTLLFNRRVPLVGTNVDICLLAAKSENSDLAIRTPEAYVALGELKGGIDPAGADEHWKTARTALDRIVKAFGKKGLKPATLFIGAAIEDRMASEIWDMLNAGTLTNAANLTNGNQLSSICNWLCSL